MIGLKGSVGGRMGAVLVRNEESDVFFVQMMRVQNFSQTLLYVSFFWQESKLHAARRRYSGNKQTNRQELHSLLYFLISRTASGQVFNPDSRPLIHSAVRF